MSKPPTRKTRLKLEIKELCNETKPPLDIPHTFPEISDETLENSNPKEKLSLISSYLKQQKQSYQTYKKHEQRLLEKDHKKEMFLLKYNTFDGFPKHSKVFQTRIKEQEIFSDFLFQTNNKKSNNLKKNSFLNSCGRQPWNYAASTSNFFDEMSHYRKSTKEINVKLEKIANKNTRQVLWENFTHPTAFFERQDVDEWDLKIKRNIKKTGLFVPNTKTEGFFEKTLKDYN